MVAIDTNVLLRLFVNDDAAQAAKARAFFDSHADEDESLWVADVVLAELAWALARSYDRPRADISAAMSALAGHATVSLESAGCIDRAIRLYEKGPADFVDCLLAAKAEQRGCAALRSFDKRMKGLPGVTLL